MLDARAAVSILIMLNQKSESEKAMTAFIPEHFRPKLLLWNSTAFSSSRFFFLLPYHHVAPRWNIDQPHA